MAGSPIEWADGSAVRLDRRDPYLRLQSVSIFVRDLDRSLDFYVKQLGFELVFDARSQESAGRQFVTVAPPDGTANLTLVAPERDSDQYKLIGRPSQVTFVTEDVLAKFREWSARGVRFLVNPRLRRLKYAVQPRRPATSSSPAAEHPPIWGGVFARFRDPDGNSFSLVSFDEVTHAVEAQRRAIAEKIETERRAAQELDIAKQVQARLFPQTLPPLKTLEYAGVCRQARQVGGDYYDFLDLGGERLGFVIGDISGKGIAAALLMANLQANLRSQSAIAVDQPQRLLRSVNQLFCENTTDGAFATLFFAEYDDATRRLRYANCGHLAALLLRCNDAIERLESTATVLGVFKRWDCEIGETQIFPGDILALYTDGITESFNDAGEQFGEERLAAALCRDRTLSSDDLLNTIVDKVRQFSPREQQDD
ncbi:MAG: SpoIIE family protein phosphatase, partial [Acidobacteria bacterium Pan2503]|nr:SpoIIE family protein phosphatase [Candidatus Acidoferrum panamensis]